MRVRLLTTGCPPPQASTFIAALPLTMNAMALRAGYGEALASPNKRMHATADTQDFKYYQRCGAAVDAVR